MIQSLCKSEQNGTTSNLGGKSVLKDPSGSLRILRRSCSEIATGFKQNADLSKRNTHGSFRILPRILPFLIEALHGFHKYGHHTDSYYNTN